MTWNHAPVGSFAGEGTWPFDGDGQASTTAPKSTAVTRNRRATSCTELPFDLMSDPDHEVLEAYGAWGAKKMYGKTIYGVIRSHYVIDEKSKLETGAIKDYLSEILGPYLTDSLRPDMFVLVLTGR